jgi:hypothetical protein
MMMMTDAEGWVGDRSCFMTIDHGMRPLMTWVFVTKITDKYILGWMYC